MIAALQPRRFVFPLVVVVMIGGAVVTYQAKHDAAQAAEHVSDLRNQIVQEQVAISLLKAEWSELTQPGRLQELVARFPYALALGPFGIDQMVSIRDLPMALSPAQQPDLIAEVLGGAGR